MRKILISLVTITVLFIPSILNASLCSEESGFFGTYKPLIVPIELSVSQDGVSLSLSDRILTPLGEVGLGYAKDFKETGNDCYYVIVNNLNTNKRTTYELTPNKQVIYEDKGKTKIKVTTDILEITVAKGESFELSLVDKMQRSLKGDRKKLINYFNTESDFYNNGSHENDEYWCSKKGKVIMRTDNKNKLLAIKILSGSTSYEDASFEGYVAGRIQGIIYNSDLLDSLDDISTDKRCYKYTPFGKNTTIIICDYREITELPISGELLESKYNEISRYSYCQ